MRRYFKFPAWILTLALLLSAWGITGTAAGAGTDTVLFDLQSLGIVSAGEETQGEAVSRGEFCILVSRMLEEAYLQQQFPQDSYFRDIPSEHPAKNVVEALRRLGIISGSSGSDFAPEQPVTRDQASKILTGVLGYGKQAIEHGGYPNGYNMTAASLGLYAGLGADADGALGRTNVYRMLYNALDVNRMTLVLGTQGSYEVTDGNTIRQLLTQSKELSDTMASGVVTATIDAYTISPVSNMRADKIEIDGTLYNTRVPDGKQYLGQQVYYYLQRNDALNRDEIVSMIPTKNNTITQVKADGIVEAGNGRVRCETEEGNKIKTLSLSADVVILRNNQPKLDWTVDALGNLKDGEIKFIDCNNDGKVEYVFVTQYETVVADEVMEPNSTVYFKEGFTCGGLNTLELAPDDTDIFVYLYDAEGNAIEPEDVKPDDVLSIVISEDETKRFVYVSRKIIRAAVTAVEADAIYLDGEVYDVADGIALSPGDRVEAFLSVYDEVVYTRDAGEGDYLYIVDSKTTSSVGGTAQIKALIPAILQEKTQEQENENGGESTSISYLRSFNDRVETFTLENRIKVHSENGSRTVTADEADSLVGKVYRYSVNSSGTLSSLEELSAVGDKAGRYYNSYERTFGKTSASAFGISQNTYVICLPLGDSAPTNADYLTPVEMNNGQMYTVEAYELDETEGTVKLIVIHSVMKANSPGLVNTKSTVALVNRAFDSVDETGEPIRKFELLTKEGEKAYDVSSNLGGDAAGITDFSNVRRGDLIAYSLDGKDRIDAYTLLGRIPDQKEPNRQNAYGDYETFYGYVQAVENNQVSRTLNRWVSRIQVGFAPAADTETIYETYKSNPPPVFVYNSRSQTAKLGSVKELRSGYDKVFFAVANTTVRAIVIIR